MRPMMIRVALVLLTVLAALLSTGCDDDVLAGRQCTSDDECLSPRLCERGFCVDPEGLDTGVFDADGGDVDIPDALPDATPDIDLPDVPDVPPPVNCLEVDTTVVDFGDLPLGIEGVRTLTLRNCGRLDVTVRGLEFGAGGDVFDTALSSTPLVLGEGDSETLTIVAKRDVPGAVTTELRVNADAVVDPVLLTANFVDGGGGDPCVRVRPLTDFGTVELDTFAGRSVVIENCGGVDLSVVAADIEGAARGSFRLASPDLPTIPAFGAAPVEVQFAPERAGALEAQLVVTTDLAGTAVGTLFGIGGEPGGACLAVSDDLIDFGVVLQGERRITSVQLTNCGEQALRLAPPVVSGTGGLVTADTTLLLDPGESAPLDVQLRAERPPGFAGQIRIDVTNVEVAPIIVDVRATITAVTEPCLSFQVPELDLGSAAPGERNEIEILLVNCGSVDIDIDSITPPRDPALSIESGRLFVPAGEVVPVVFALTGDGTARDVFQTITVRGTGGASASIDVFGQVLGGGGTACIEPAFDSAAFGPVPVGELSELSLRFRNCGDEPLRVVSAPISGDTDAFSLFTPGGDIGAGRTFTVLASFFPPERGDFAATFRLVTADGSSFGPWELSGTGIVDGEPCITFDPPSVGFGDVAFDDLPVERAVTLRNCGDRTVDVFGVFPSGGAGFDLTDIGFAEFGPGDAIELELRFDPPRAGSWEQTFTAEADGASATLDVFGTAIDAVEACVLVEPPEIFFDGVPAGTVVNAVAFIINCGETPLTLRESVLDGDDGFSVTFPGFPDSLLPGEELQAQVAFSGLRPGLYEARYLADFGSVAAFLPLTAFVTADRLGPIIRIEPPVAEFGDVFVGATGTATVRVCNDGDDVLELGMVNVVEATRPWFSVASVPAVVPVGSCRNLTFRMTPSGVPDGAIEDAAGFALIESNARNAEDGFVELFGVAIGDETGETCLSAVRPSISFGTFNVGETSTQRVEFTNCGDTPITVIDLVLEGGGQFTVASTSMTPALLEPGATIAMTVRFRATTPGTAAAEVVVLTADGLISAASLTARVELESCPALTAGGALVLNGPFAPSLGAVVDSTVFLDPGLSADLGSGVRWRAIETPSGGRFTTSTTSTPGRVRWIPNVTGTWVLEAVFTGDDGCVSSDTVEVRVSRATGVGEGLRVVITWRTPGDADEFTDPGSDVDLHYAREIRGDFDWNSEDDCYFGNRNPTSWGSPGDTTDDPRLLRDEVNGVGPEILVHENPSESRYQVGVYYFSDSGFGPSEVTLRIFWDGVQVTSATRTLERTGRFWPAAEVTDGGRTIRLLDVPNRDGF